MKIKPYFHISNIMQPFIKERTRGKFRQLWGCKKNCSTIQPTFLYIYRKCHLQVSFTDKLTNRGFLTSIWAYGGVIRVMEGCYKNLAPSGIFWTPSRASLNDLLSTFKGLCDVFVIMSSLCEIHPINGM